MTDFIHEAPPPENPKPAAPEKPTSEKERQKRVYAYIAVLFTVAFILILWSFLANHRSNQQVIDQLKGSTSMMQSTLEQNAKLEDEVKALETQVGELEQTLAETEDALSAAQEETEKYRALYEELAGAGRDGKVPCALRGACRRGKRNALTASRASPVYAPFHTIL